MIKEMVIELIAREMQCSVQDITLSTELSEIGVDSLKAVVLMSLLEEEFKIEIPNDALDSISTVGDIVDKVEALCPKNPS